ncbi:hypothetical protein TGVAND_238073 [Toxoplasma gondii VAND]|uniref:Uncharacterized protein n=1 Tax=Toxoplasma gondii VAND TaxID=933077 RepID=A0A086PGX5_TOXGO|nr:hypothetical protein TGVAND_238073 [Toxoplasma gondii VAND]
MFSAYLYGWFRVSLQRAEIGVCRSFWLMCISAQMPVRICTYVCVCVCREVQSVVFFAFSRWRHLLSLLCFSFSARNASFVWMFPAFSLLLLHTVSSCLSYPHLVCARRRSSPAESRWCLLWCTYTRASFSSFLPFVRFSGVRFFFRCACVPGAGVVFSSVLPVPHPRPSTSPLFLSLPWLKKGGDGRSEKLSARRTRALHALRLSTTSTSRKAAVRIRERHPF